MSRRAAITALTVLASEMRPLLGRFDVSAIEKWSRVFGRGALFGTRERDGERVSGNRGIGGGKRIVADVDYSWMHLAMDRNAGSTIGGYAHSQHGNSGHARLHWHCTTPSMINDDWWLRHGCFVYQPAAS